jgi:hypothetical protein
MLCSSGGPRVCFCSYNSMKFQGFILLAKPGWPALSSSGAWMLYSRMLQVAYTTRAAGSTLWYVMLQTAWQLGPSSNEHAVWQQHITSSGNLLCTARLLQLSSAACVRVSPYVQYACSCWLQLLRHRCMRQAQHVNNCCEVGLLQAGPPEFAAATPLLCVCCCWNPVALSL